MQRLLALAFFLVALLVPAFAAQDQQPPKKFEDAMWRVANGLVKSADGKMVPLPPGETILQETEAALARELAQAEVTREFAAAAQRLAALRARATWHEVPRREDLLTRIAVARAKLLERTGDMPGALRALDEFYVRDGEQLAEPLGLRPASFEEMRQRALALNTSSVRSLTEKLKKAADAPTDTDDAIASAVREALTRGNSGGILELGRRAVPALVLHAGQGTDVWLPQINDPLHYLVSLDESRAAQLIIEHFDRGGPFWKRRALRAMSNSKVLDNEGTFVSQDDGQALVDVWWLPVVLRLVQDPDTAQESMPFVQSLAVRDALGEPLIGALSKVARGTDPSLVAALQKVLGTTPNMPGTRRILESLLDAPEQSLRDFAALQLLRYAEPSARGAARRTAQRSGDPKVRIAVVKSFNNQIADPQDIAVLDALLHDADPSVRRDVIRMAREKNLTIADATLFQLAGDSDPKVRTEIGLVAYRAKEELAVRLFAELADDKDPEVLATFDSAIVAYLGRRKQDDDLGPLLPALDARFANPVLPIFAGKDEDMAGLAQRLWPSADARQMLGRWALSGNPGWRMAVLLEMIKALQKINWNARQERSVAGVPFDDAQLVRLLREEVTGHEFEVHAVARGASRLRIDDPEPWRRLALDSSAPIPLRFAAASAIADRADAAIARAVVELASNPAWASMRADGWSGFVPDVFRRLPEAQAQQALSSLLESDATPATMSQAAEGFAHAYALTPALSDAVLRQAMRGPVSVWDSKPIREALNEVASRPPEERGTWLEQAVRSPQWSRLAVQLLGRLREPHYLPLLVESLEAPWMTEANERINVGIAAIEAIGRYLDDEAVQILLDAAGRFTEAKLRQACYDELNRIKSHLATRDEWEARRRAGATKDAAITALLPMLDSKDAVVRAQAARSLATLGAVEELPRLVKLLQDPEPNVRQAAQRALEVLNASTGTPR